MKGHRSPESIFRLLNRKAYIRLSPSPFADSRCQCQSPVPVAVASVSIRHPQRSAIGSMSNKRRRRNPEAEFHVYTPGVAVPRDVTHVLVPASVEVLPDYAFEHCRNLKEVVLSAGLREIGRNVFYDCRSLVCVDVPSTLVKIGQGAFCDCTSLRELELPEGLTDIGNDAFMFCTSLVRLRLPSTVPKIPCGAFFECSSLKKVTLLDGIREIGGSAFHGCSSLEDDVFLPATLTSIGRRAFQGCRLLRGLKLSVGIQRIVLGAFYGCNLLDHVGTPSKALLAVAADGGNYSFRLVTTGGFPRPRRPHVVITSECFNSMSLAQMSEFTLAMTDILGLDTEWEWADKHQRLRALVAPHELRHKKEVTTLLELGLWKSKMMADGVHSDIREDCRLNCGASVIITGVLPFL